MTTATSADRQTRRRVVVDLVRDGTALAAGRTPVLDVAWDDDVVLDDLEVLSRAARTLAKAPSAPSPAKPLQRRSLGPVGALAASLVATAVVLLAIGLVLNAVPWLLSGISTGSGTLVAPDAGTWSTGGALPPGWAEVALVEADGQVGLVGRATAATAEDAAELARRQASDRLMEEISRKLGPSVQWDPLPPEGDPLRESAAARWSVQTSADLLLMRSDDDARRVGDGIEVVARYTIPVEEVAGFVDRHSATASFKGITVAARPPWAAPGLRLVEAASYVRNVKPGDLLLRVGNETVGTLEAFRRATDAAWSSVEPGEVVELVFDHAGTEAKTSVIRPKVAPSPRSDGGNRPSLFGSPK